MLMLPANTRIHMATEPVNFQKSIDGLSAVIRSVLEMDPLSGHLFVFHNRHHTALKILFWLDGGFCLYYKRLARGRFVLPQTEGGQRATISQAQLAALLEGLDLRQARPLSRWNPQKNSGIHTDAG